jgi:uncharacterized iron-regulated protein
MPVRRTAALVVLSLLLAACTTAAATTANTQPANGSGTVCAPAGRWLVPKDRSLRAPDKVIAELASANVALLGESHTNAEHHRWQLYTLAAIYGRNPNMVIGFEMFPRQVQGVLDRWVRGELDRKAFLEQTHWDRNWRFDPDLYMPLFYFARQNRIPMVALNVEHALVDRVREKGWASIPETEREGVSDPAPPSVAYRKFLRDTYEHHGSGDEKGADASGDADFERFTEAQLTWDRAMAQGLAEAHRREGRPLAVGIMGSGHLFRRFGVPHQLDSLGLKDVKVALPWSTTIDCDKLVPGFADVVFGLPMPQQEATETERPRLGVMIARADGGIRVERVLEDSVAAGAGLAKGDVITAAAGVALERTEDLIDIVHRQAPGTWLPLTVRRGGDTQHLVAKFPAK